MTTRRRMVWWGLAVTAFAVVPGGLLSAVVDLRPTAVRAEEWVAMHSADLPNTLAELESFPEAYRRAIFRGLDADVRSALWQSQLARLRSELLTAEQAAFLRRVEQALSPAAFRRGTTGNTTLKTLCEASAQYFDVHARHRLFGRLGSSATGYGSARAAAITLQVALNDLLRPIAAQDDGAIEVQLPCHCANNSGCDIPCGNYDCRTFDDGCGCLYMWACDGMRPGSGGTE